MHTINNNLMKGYNMKVVGYYNEQGYQIESINKEEINVLYTASNHALDSQQDGTGTQHQLSLKDIIAFCEQTTRELAEDKNAEYGGIEHTK